MHWYMEKGNWVWKPGERRDYRLEIWKKIWTFQMKKLGVCVFQICGGRVSEWWLGQV